MKRSLNSKTGNLIALAGLAMAGIGLKGCYEKIAFDCNPNLDSDLVEKINSVRECVDRVGMEGVVGHSLTFESSKRPGDDFSIATVRNLFGQDGLQLRDYGRGFQDECADGLNGVNELTLREDISGGGKITMSMIDVQNEHYRERLDEAIELCTHSEETAPETENHCAPTIEARDKIRHEILPNFERSVVQIYVSDGVCAGFFVDFEGHDLVATAKHCVVQNRECVDDNRIKCIPVDSLKFSWPSENGSGSYYTAIGLPIIEDGLNMASFQQGDDVALIAISPNIERGAIVPLSLSDAMPDGHGEYWAIGHSNGVSYSSALLDEAFSFDPTKMTGGGSKGLLGFKGSTGCGVVQGASGGPIINLEDGEVEGIFVKTSLELNATERVRAAVPASNLVGLAKRSEGVIEEKEDELQQRLDLAKYPPFTETADIEKRRTTLTKKGAKFLVVPNLGN